MLKVTLKRAFFVIVVIAFCLLRRAAAEITVEDIIDKVQYNFNQIETLRADISIKTEGDKRQSFTQETTHIMKRIEDPMAKVVFDDGGSIVIKEKEEIEIWPQPQLLFGIKGYLKSFNTEINSEREDFYVLLAREKNSSKEFPKIELYINRNDWLIEKVLNYDATGHLWRTFEIKEYQLVNSRIWMPKKVIDTMTSIYSTTRQEINYSNVQINIEISDEEFTETRKE